VLWPALRPDPDPLPDDVQLLALDSDAGTASIVVGDLDEATHVVVWVPGTGTRIVDLLAARDELERLRAETEEVARLCSDRPGSVAVVGWLGYDPPDHLLAAAFGDVAGPARAGARALVELVDELADRPAPDGAPPHVSVIGHSYGGLVVGEAGRRGLAADDVALVGSPGIGPDPRFAPETSLWVGLAPDDPIRIAHLLNAAVELLDPVSVFDPLVDTGDGYGGDPASGGLATRFLTTGADGHSEYLAAGTASLANLSAIAAGTPGAVTRAA
jgi:hypothetical protein